MFPRERISIKHILRAIEILIDEHDHPLPRQKPRDPHSSQVWPEVPVAPLHEHPDWPEAATPNEPRLNQCGKLIPRDDLKLVQVVEELGGVVNGHSAELRVVSIPDDVRWEISVVDGKKHVSEVHRTWGTSPGGASFSLSASSPDLC